MSKKLPFKISARTARLIGRQNFPNAEGAIIELVKNSYDADANTCIILFDNRFVSTPTTLQAAEYTQFSKLEPLISSYYLYDKNSGVYTLKELEPQSENQSEETRSERQALQEFFRLQCKLLVIDNGEGMTNQVIEDYWMTIGTNNKEVDFATNSGRVKTGEKGIGRFALDKLGDKAEMVTVPASTVYPEVAKNSAYLWQVDWNVFEGNAKTLNQVEADLVDLENFSYVEHVRGALRVAQYEQGDLRIGTFATGTLIEISALREVWDDYAVSKLYTDLEVLIPPREERIFDIYLFSTQSPRKFGRVLPSICDDYDYKVDASVTEHGVATISIYRNEFDVRKLPDKLFDRDAMKKEGFTRTDFLNGKIEIVRHINELVPGLSEVDDENLLDSVGAFEATFYFMKAQATKNDRKVFLYKDFSSASRKAWLDLFGGIKLFRDNFRVRPYGEVSNPAFDWLQLGERAARSPASLGQQRSGAWKVRPNQITGVISISRLTNIDFEDTSSRYGLQQNRAFGYFTKIIRGLLEVFERDRSYIGRQLRAHYDETHQEEVSEEIAEDAKTRVGRVKSKREISQVEEDALTLLRLAETLEDQIEELRDETNLLRILSTNGLVIASFTHELRNIEDNLVFRIDELSDSFQTVVDIDKCRELPNFLNPFKLLEVVKHEDEKLKEWLHYSLETLRRDKRRRNKRDLMEYFRTYVELWRAACDKRGVQFSLVLPEQNELKIRVFEADLDCIFNNLLINSFEAFLRKDAPAERRISLEVAIHEPDIHIMYTDSGPGLSRDIVEPDQIFEPHFTTKKDVHTGEDIGTGLGMWLVRSFVNDNNGEVSLLDDVPGFGVIIRLKDKVNRDDQT